MRTMERLIIAGAVCLLLLLFLYPPWMSVDSQSGGRVHAALGHYAIWDPPPPESIFLALYPNARELPNAERLADFRPRINRVRIVIYVLAIVVVCSLSILMLRRRRRRTQLH